MHIYDDIEINKIENITKEYEADEYITPVINLLGSIILFIGGIYIIYKSTLIKKKSLTGVRILCSALAVLLMSLIVVRNFMIFHDLGHCNYFPTKERETGTSGINTNICEILDFMYFFPGRSWRLGHKEHHKVHGNKGEYDQGRTITWTTEDYEKASDIEKMAYDILRHPIIFFILMPIYIFVVQHIIDLQLIYFIKLGIMLYVIYKIFGLETLLLLLLSLYGASMIGIILFHWQHSINEPYWKDFDLKNDKNSKMNAELNGSSVLKIPEILKLFTNGIEYHNVHHVNPGVPSYNIRECYEKLREKGLLKNREICGNELWEALSHTIYDNKSNKYVYHYNL